MSQVRVSGRESVVGMGPSPGTGVAQGVNVVEELRQVALLHVHQALEDVQPGLKRSRLKGGQLQS